MPRLETPTDGPSAAPEPANHGTDRWRRAFWISIVVHCVVLGLVWKWNPFTRENDPREEASAMEMFLAPVVVASTRPELPEFPPPPPPELPVEPAPPPRTEVETVSLPPLAPTLPRGPVLPAPEVEIASRVPEPSQPTPPAAAPPRPRSSPASPTPPPAPAQPSIVSQPELIGKAGFSYPSAARRAGREGLVMVAFIVSEKGRVSAPQVVDSSGHKDLDAAALRAVAGWKFRPARLSDGTTVEHRIRVPIDFRLR